MKIKLFFAILLSAAALLTCVNVAAENATIISVGADYSSGKYGASEATDMWYFPFSVKYQTESWFMKLAVPYIRSTGPGSIVGGNGDRVPTAQTEAAQITESGVGDVSLSAGYTVLNVNAWSVDLNAKLKLPTADEERGLGTGETDQSVEAEVIRSIGNGAFFATLGRKFYGDPPGIDYHDPVYVSAGGMVKSGSVFGGIAYDWREAVIDAGDEVSEATLFFVFRLNASWKVQLYAVKGFSDASPDWGTGSVLSYRF